MTTPHRTRRPSTVRSLFHRCSRLDRTVARCFVPSVAIRRMWRTPLAPRSPTVRSPRARLRFPPS